MRRNRKDCQAMLVLHIESGSYESQCGKMHSITRAPSGELHPPAHVHQRNLIRPFSVGYHEQFIVSSDRNSVITKHAYID